MINVASRDVTYVFFWIRFRIKFLSRQNIIIAKLIISLLLQV